MAAQVAHVSNKIADGYFTCWGFPALLRHCPIQRRPLWVAASSRVKMPYTFASQARWTAGQWFYVILLFLFFCTVLCYFYANVPLLISSFSSGIRCTFSNRGNGCRPGSDRWFGERQGHHGEALRLGCTGQFFCWEKGGMIWRNNSCILIIHVYY